MIHRKKRLCRILCSCRPFTSNKRGAPKTDLHRTNQQKTVFFAWVFHRAHLFWQNFLHFPSKNWSRSLLVFGWHSLCPQPWTLEIEAWNYTLYRIYGCCWVTWGKKRLGMMRLVASLNWEVFGVYMEMVRIEPLGVQKVFRIWVNDLMMCGDRVGWWGWDEMVFFLDLNLCQPSTFQNIRPFSWEKVSWVIQFCVWVFFSWNSPNEQKFFGPGGHSDRGQSRPFWFTKNNESLCQ